MTSQRLTRTCGNGDLFITCVMVSSLTPAWESHSHYRVQTKYGEGNVFIGMCHSIHKGRMHPGCTPLDGPPDALPLEAPHGWVPDAPLLSWCFPSQMHPCGCISWMHAPQMHPFPGCTPLSDVPSASGWRVLILHLSLKTFHVRRWNSSSVLEISHVNLVLEHFGLKLVCQMC